MVNGKGIEIEENDLIKAGVKTGLSKNRTQNIIEKIKEECKFLKPYGTKR